MQEHHKLWFYKLLTSGALLSFAFSQKGIAQFGCVLSPLLAIVFDFLILNNLIIINALGEYIKIEIESKHFVNGWETKSRERYISGPKFSWFTDWVVVIISTILIYVLSIYASISLTLLKGYKFSIIIYILTGVFFLLVYVFPFKHMSEKKNK